ncbi:type IV pilin protein [Acinetobacter indicus]|uniref:type IV pilin protein n=1 Tax=Acinetobacter indicus TaxID=756892 RepID=UPI000CEBF700|nr:prepilin-type N-terminal cleavage/methylation domain-containing protein [Acinetobacter indicus]MDM1243424.1 prepilin-type N-terminal cleavage/methylation domain-containing protein [Acinetobacter indicus]MDM1287280.1 prepilin-type N-terminal cleavage/methylation domain-containing protein [Acinetobacter indicus]
MIKYNGFTLIELMIVVVVISVIAGIAIPSYQNQVRRAAEANVTEEMLKISELLEKHKAKNFTYRCFDLADYYGGAANRTSLTLPIGATGNEIRYTISLIQIGNPAQPLVTGACSDPQTQTLGSVNTWSMVTTKNTSNKLVGSRSFNYLMNSEGLKCKNQANNLTTNSCGIGGELW